jgi:hypothetical protein
MNDTIYIKTFEGKSHAGFWSSDDKTLGNAYIPKLDHDRIVKAKDAEIAELKRQVQIYDECLADNILAISEYGKRIAELEAILEARGE